MLEKSAHIGSTSKPPGDFAYQRHNPEETDLYKIIEQNLPPFQSHLSNADISLPSFVHDEFRSYLRCGLLEHGFLRVKCNGCRFEHLVAFSCKLRGFCRILRGDESACKVRTGGPIDDDEDISLPFWAGEIPITQVYGEPVPSADLQEGIKTPEYAKQYKRPVGESIHP